MLDIFGFLDGISPWWWVALSLLLVTAEVLVLGFFLIWPALAALSVALALWIDPAMTGALQLAVFAVLGVVYTILGRRVVLSTPAETETPGLNQRAARLVGRTAHLVGAVEADGFGTVEIDGVRWRGRIDKQGADLPEGAPVLVVGAEGMILLLAPDS